MNQNHIIRRIAIKNSACHGDLDRVKKQREMRGKVTSNLHVNASQQSGPAKARGRRQPGVAAPQCAGVALLVAEKGLRTGAGSSLSSPSLH